MKMSPDKTKLAITCINPAVTGAFGSIISSTGRTAGTLLCEFDAGTGIVSNSMLIDTLGGYSVCFSPDNSKLYLTSGVNLNQPIGLYQFDISTMDSTAIVKSKTTIQAPLSSAVYSDLKLYNDTIYLDRPDQIAIDRINNPNRPGAACGYEANAITFPSGIIGLSLPSDVVFPFSDTLHYRVMDSMDCFGEDGIILRPEASSYNYHYEWNNGSTDSILEATHAGTYWVRYNDGCRYRVDTFVLSGYGLNPVINVDEFNLSTTLPYNTYQWMLNDTIIPGATKRNYTVTQNGNYRVIVSNNRCTDTSDVYKVTNVSMIGNIQQVAEQINIYPNPANNFVYINAPIKINLSLCSIEGKILKQVKKSNRISLQDLAEGIYFLQIYDVKGKLIKMEKIIKGL